jgi:hypothetical protein
MKHVLPICLPFLLCKKLSLDPPDKRPVASVTIADGDEVALLRQQLKLEIVEVKQNTLYYIDQPGISERLKTFGYTPAQQVALSDLYYKIVRIQLADGRQPPKTLPESVTEIMRRDKDAWVIRASLSVLQRLKRDKTYLLSAQKGEVFPHQFRAIARNREEVNFISANVSDIIQVIQQKNETLVVDGAAFDYQLDLLKQKGIEFTITE